MAKSKTRSRKSAKPALAKSLTKRSSARRVTAAPKSTTKAATAKSKANTARAPRNRTAVAALPMMQAFVPALPARPAQPSLLAETLRPALRRIARHRRQLAALVRRDLALLRLSARQEKRRLERTIQTRLRRIDALRREARSLRRDLGFAARRRLRQFRADGARFTAASHRAAQLRLRRALRDAREAVSRKAERSLDDANRAMQRTFRPVMRNVMPYRRAAIAGGTAAVIVALLSLGFIALFDQATAVPSREGRLPGYAISRAERWQGLPGRDPVLANIDLAPSVAPAASAIAPALARPVIEAVPLPVPARRQAAPAKVERQAPRHSLRSREHATTRSVRRHVSDAAVTSDYGHETFTSLASGNSLIAEARRYLGTNPTGRSSLWCGAFMDLVLRKTGHKGGGNLALGYEHYGTRVAGPEVGAIAVMTRRGGGHVGVVSGIDANGNPIIVSGNHNNTVAEAVYPRSRIIAYVEPN
jgi:uncharacterized protein (TIGR02594 family)